LLETYKKRSEIGEVRLALKIAEVSQKKNC